MRDSGARGEPASAWRDRDGIRRPDAHDASAPRVDVHLRGSPPGGIPCPAEHARDLVEAHDRGDQRRGVHAVWSRTGRGRRAGRASALRIPIAVRSLSTTCRLSTRLGRPDRPIQTTRRPGSTRSTARAGQRGGVRRVDHGVGTARGGTVDAVHTCSNPSDSANRTDGSRRARRWTSTPRGPRHQRDQQPDRARAEHQQPLAGPDRGRLHRPPGVAAGLDQRPTAVVDGVGQGEEGRRRHRELLGQRARPAVPDADLEPVRAQVLPAAAAPVAAAAAEHRVAGDPPPDPAPRRRPDPTDRTVPHHSCPIRSG